MKPLKVNGLATVWWISEIHTQGKSEAKKRAN